MCNRVHVKDGSQTLNMGSYADRPFSVIIILIEESGEIDHLMVISYRQHSIFISLFILKQTIRHHYITAVCAGSVHH